VRGKPSAAFDDIYGGGGGGDDGDDGDGDDEGGSKYLFSDRATCCDMWFCVHGACLDGGELGVNSSTCRPTRSPPTTSTMSV
jgi:hypothetical protein